MIALLVLALPFVAQADLLAGIRRAQVVDAVGSLAQAPLPQDAPSSAIIVKLKRVNEHKKEDIHGEYYVGNISVGSPPQRMSVLFHTSSGHVLLPHRACTLAACTEHKRYSPWQSMTAMDVNLNGQLVTEGHRYAKGNVKRQAIVLDYTDSDHGDGEAKSLIVRDHVCMNSVSGEKGCVDIELLAATSLPDSPFRAMPNDGILGLGLESLAAGPLCSFFGRFLEGSKNMLPQFGISYGLDGGEVHFGGQDENHFVPPLRWLPVQHPEDGYWQVAIRAVRVGSTVIDDCKQGCSGVVDTGASRIGVQTSKFPKFEEVLKSHAVVGPDDVCEGPELVFDLGDFTMALATEDYTDTSCGLQMGPVHLDTKNSVYVFAAPLLRRYYAAFDWESYRVGFARSAQPTRRSPANALQP